MASSNPKPIQLTAVDPAINLAFRKEAGGYASQSALFEEMWRAYLAAQTQSV